MTIIREYMTKNPLTIRDSETLYDARVLMGDHHIRHLPVINQESGEVTGIFTQRDLLACTVSVLADVDENDINEIESGIKISEVMTRSFVGMQDDDDMLEAADYFLDHNHSCLPVFGGATLVGILTEVDFIKLAKKHLS
ncbi:MAG: CBS domain-containing protein [Thiotrichales bacterium]|nr:CBS domain-containing protein [Thiotrichales bacterium]MBT3838275.1 CBS domain-containing protein [Thiotrichales bacterium]MBT4151686.1 CBS domain-containing protein [Thiotrichales bacterium]MBT4262440.1 CBS domain-containing protein [Thiotrichales bacterium]MBT4574063.1 CBS domain-containing protein [Thiotrichales bacterium]